MRYTNDLQGRAVSEVWCRPGWVQLTSGEQLPGGTWDWTPVPVFFTHFCHAQHTATAAEPAEIRSPGCRSGTTLSQPSHFAGTPGPAFWAPPRSRSWVSRPADDAPRLQAIAGVAESQQQTATNSACYTSLYPARKDRDGMRGEVWVGSTRRRQAQPARRHLAQSLPLVAHSKIRLTARMPARRECRFFYRWPSASVMRFSTLL